MRNLWAGGEVVLAPLVDVQGPYVVRMKNVTEAEVLPRNRGNTTLVMAVGAASDEARVEIASAARPREVKGAVSWAYADGVVTAKIRAGTTLEVK